MDSPTMEEARELNELLAEKLRLIEEQSAQIRELQNTVHDMKETQTSGGGSVTQETERPLDLNNDPSIHNIILDQLSSLARKIEKLEKPNVSQTPPSQNRECNGPRITIKDALAYVPVFNGYNMSVSQFMRACTRACSMLNESTVPMFLELMRQKFEGRARNAVENLEYRSVQELEIKLRDMFDPYRTANQCKAALENVVKGPSEHVVDYINRVQILYHDILNIETQERTLLSASEKFKIEKDAVEAFFNGLPPPIRIQCWTKPHSTLDEAYKAAIEVDKIFQRDNVRFCDYGGFVGLTQTQQTSTTTTSSSNLPKNQDNIHVSSSQSNGQQNQQNLQQTDKLNNNSQNQGNTNSQNQNFNHQNNNNNRGNNFRNNYSRNQYQNRGYNNNNRRNFYNNNNQNYRYNNNNNNNNNTNNNNNNFQRKQPQSNSNFEPNKFCELCRISGHDLSTCRRLAAMNQKLEASKNGERPEVKNDGTAGKKSSQIPSQNQTNNVTSSPQSNQMQPQPSTSGLRT